MKIQLLSDLHLESHPGLRLTPSAEADVLVLAGDIGSYQRGSQLTGADFGLERFAPSEGWPRTVLYVPGNHEYDGLDFDDTHRRLRAICERLGMTWLERETVVLDGVRFIGTTLWTDFEALAQSAPDETRRLKAVGKAMRAANFYLQRNTAMRGGEPLLAEGWRALGLACQQWLDAALAQPFEGTTVVVTHFAPSLRSVDPRYGLTPGSAGFCNGLDPWFERADLWVHGHLHCPQDYQAGRCRVLANARGYASKGEQEGFRERYLIDVARRAPVAEVTS